jgi:hypothetical protein
MNKTCIINGKTIEKSTIITALMRFYVVVNFNALKELIFLQIII